MSPSRRDMLKVLFGAGGAFALGFSLPGCGGVQARIAEHADANGEFQPNAWLKITQDNAIVFVLDRVEMGQGTMTSHATLLAEELDVDPRKLRVVLAPAHRAYDNPDPALGFQITGGSTSVHTSWVPLRKAGATARHMLRAAAAATWGVSIDECATDDGEVYCGRTRQRATYGSLAKMAAHQAIPEAPPLKEKRDRKWIGNSMQRLDARVKVDGTAVYGLDVKVDGLHVAVVVRSPVFGGKLLKFEARDALAMPGVTDVVAIPSGVAIVASSYPLARAAAKKVAITWDEAALARYSTDVLRAEYTAHLKSPGRVVREEGDFEKTSASGRVIEATYEAPYLAHATMEPQNCTARFVDGNVEVWAPTQSPGLAREEVRRITGLPYEAITIHQTMVGGGFGRRLAQDYVVEAVQISKRVKKPVKLIFSREDDTRHDFYRPFTLNAMRAVIEGDRVVGWFHRMVSQSIVGQIGKTWMGAIAPSGMPMALKHFMGRTAGRLYQTNTVSDNSTHEGASDFAYGIPNVRVEHVAVEPGLPVGFWRSVGNSENVFFVESFLDEVAHALKKDPVALRREMLSKSPRHLAVLDRATSEAAWGKPLPEGHAHGVAVAKAFGAYCAHVAEVSVKKGLIRVHRVVAAIDCGTVINPDLVKAQVESAIVFGLSAALKQAITYEHGRVRESGFFDYPTLRMHESPRIDVHIIDSSEDPSGVGEGGLPPIAPAVANAIFTLTGKRLRTMPLERALEASGG
jgi:isoquinoline 1-oxidoreductase/isoquinoline 1-oxidoreductase beta subunit